MANKRFKHGVGITNPCQLRYVKYFEMLLNNLILSPTIKILKSIEMHGIPSMSSKS